MPFHDFTISCKRKFISMKSHTQKYHAILAMDLYTWSQWLKFSFNTLLFWFLFMLYSLSFWNGKLFTKCPKALFELIWLYIISSGFFRLNGTWRKSFQGFPTVKIIKISIFICLYFWIMGKHPRGYKSNVKTYQGWNIILNKKC